MLVMLLRPPSFRVPGGLYLASPGRTDWDLGSGGKFVASCLVWLISVSYGAGAAGNGYVGVWVWVWKSSSESSEATVPGSDECMLGTSINPSLSRDRIPRPGELVERGDSV